MFIYSELTQDVDFAVTPGMSRSHDDSDTDVDIDVPSTSRKSARVSCYHIYKDYMFTKIIIKMCLKYYKLLFMQIYMLYFPHFGTIWR